VRFELITNDN